MEKLIAENQKMKIKLEEYEKKDLYFKRQMHEVSKVTLFLTHEIRNDIQHKKYSEIEKAGYYHRKLLCPLTLVKVKAIGL
jgi:hypothetical protein